MKHTPRRSRDSGFTIIEVLIVVAIAGLIIAIVFIAIPALKRNSRDFTRKHAVELTASALEQFNLSYGHYPRDPGDWVVFEENNPEISNDFDFEFYDFGGGHEYMPPLDTIAVEYGHWCNRYGNGNNDTDPIAGDHRAANLYVIWGRLEGSSKVFCVDNWDSKSNL